LASFFGPIWSTLLLAIYLLELFSSCILIVTMIFSSKMENVEIMNDFVENNLKAVEIKWKESVEINYLFVEINSGFVEIILIHS
jgi:hypothetical protein